MIVMARMVVSAEFKTIWKKEKRDHNQDSVSKIPFLHTKYETKGNPKTRNSNPTPKTQNFRVLNPETKTTMGFFLLHQNNGIVINHHNHADTTNLTAECV